MTAPVAAVSSYLSDRGWTNAGALGPGIRFIPPTELGLPGDFFVVLPSSEDMPGGSSSLAAVVATVADVYGLSSETLSATLLRDDQIFSIQLQSDSFADGSMPLPLFEAVIERLKRALLHTASFVLNESPTIESVPDEARTYLTHCRFLQTERGSYVARVRLPPQSALTVPTLLADVAVTTVEVNERFGDIVAFILTNVLPSDARPFDEDVFENSLDLINVDVLKDLRDLIDRSEAREISFAFSSGSNAGALSTGILTSTRIQRLDSFITFAQDRLAGDQEIDLTGRIIELRSRRPDRRRNHVLVAGLLDGREVLVGISMSRRDYPTATTAHDRNRLVHVRGLARQMKTQWRITRLLVFEDIGGTVGPDADA